MSISKQRWIKTGDPRSGDEVYDDEGNEQYCFLCGEGLKSLESDFCLYCGSKPCDACGHPRDCHANENVQPNCCECGCAGFSKESVCSECDDYLEPKTPEDRVYVALFNAHRECLEALTPADHAERVKKLVHAWQDAAWLKFEADCKRSGMVASAYTAFKCGYRAGKFDYETEGRQPMSEKATCRCGHGQADHKQLHLDGCPTPHFPCNGYGCECGKFERIDWDEADANRDGRQEIK